jgi:hypothetical protein
MSRYDLILKKPGLCEICEREEIYIKINGVAMGKKCYEEYLRKNKGNKK